MRMSILIDLLAVCRYSLGGLPNPVKNKMVQFFAGNPQVIKLASVAKVGIRNNEECIVSCPAILGNRRGKSSEVFNMCAEIALERLGQFV